MAIDERTLDIRYTPRHKSRLSTVSGAWEFVSALLWDEKISAAFGQQDKVVLEVRFLIFHLLGSIPATKLYSLSQHVV
jgi:hypothetical protein